MSPGLGKPHVHQLLLGLFLLSLCHLSLGIALQVVTWSSLRQLFEIGIPVPVLPQFQHVLNGALGECLSRLDGSPGGCRGTTV